MADDIPVTNTPGNTIINMARVLYIRKSLDVGFKEYCNFDFVLLANDNTITKRVWAPCSEFENYKHCMSSIKK